MPSQPTDPDAREWELACLTETRKQLTPGRLPNRSFHTVELQGEPPDTVLVIEYTDIDGTTETVRRFRLWKNPSYRIRRSGAYHDPGSISSMIVEAIFER